MRQRKSDRADQYQMPEFLTLQQRLATNARRLRVERGWSQTEAAANCEMLTQHYFRVEAGVLNTTLTTIARLCRGFRVEPQELFAPVQRRARVVRRRAAS